MESGKYVEAIAKFKEVIEMEKDEKEKENTFKSLGLIIKCKSKI